MELKLNNRLFRPATLLLMALFFAGCYHDIHEIMPSVYPGIGSVGYLGSALSWENDEDAGTDIHSLTMSLTGAGQSFAYTFSNDEQASLQLQQLPAGDYEMLVTVNMTEADGYILDNKTVSLKDSSKNTAQAWYGITGVTVTDDAVSVAQASLHRMLSVLTLNIDGLPDSSKLMVGLGHIARSVNLTARTADGGYGVSSTESFDAISYDTVTLNKGGKQSVRYLIFPTAGGQDSCYLTVEIMTTDSVKFAYERNISSKILKGSNTLDLNLNSFIPYNFIEPLDSVTLATPLTFEAKKAGATVKFHHSRYFDGKIYFRCETSSRWSRWTPYTEGHIINLVNKGDKVQFKGNNETYNRLLSSDNSNFHLTEDCYLYGNIMSLIKSENFDTCTTLTGHNCFYSLFYNEPHLLFHHNKRLILPATTLSPWCYNRMFEQCSGLTVAPELPATVLAEGCYAGMFEGCSSLISAPKLPAETLDSLCYEYMFASCSNLITPPELPVNKLSFACYTGMFEFCTSLTIAPVLPADSLVEYCYEGMFYGCTSLSSITCLATDVSAEDCTDYWLEEAGTDVAGTKTFITPQETAWDEDSDDGIPSGWTRVDYTTP